MEQLSPQRSRLSHGACCQCLNPQNKGSPGCWQLPGLGCEIRLCQQEGSQQRLAIKGEKPLRDAEKAPRESKQLVFIFF